MAIVLRPKWSNAHPVTDDVRASINQHVRDIGGLGEYAIHAQLINAVVKMQLLQVHPILDFLSQTQGEEDHEITSQRAEAQNRLRAYTELCDRGDVNLHLDWAVTGALKSLKNMLDREEFTRL